jgi:hypothetical protein
MRSTITVQLYVLLMSTVKKIMNSLSTTIEEDKEIIQHGKRHLGMLKELGTKDMNVADVVMGIKFSLRLKRFEIGDGGCGAGGFL